MSNETRRSTLQQLGVVLSMLAAAVPFAFALIRAITTGTDFRYVWMAIVALLGAVAAMAMGTARGRKPTGWIAVTIAALVVATLLAGGVGFLVGARRSASIWIVAVSFGLCEAAGVALRLLSRPRSA